MTDSRLSDLPNIGVTLEARLGDIGILSREDLEAVGPVAAYRLMCREAGRLLPLCYNLYSLDAALTDEDWRQLDESRKKALQDGIAKDCAII